MLWEKLSKPESNLSWKYSIAFGDAVLFMIFAIAYLLFCVIPFLIQINIGIDI